jgi:CBS-domain-containing membrane protein
VIKSDKIRDQPINPYSKKEILKSGMGGFIGMSILSTLHYGLAPGDITTVLASFGATSMIIFGFPDTPFAQPKNVVGGHIISCFWGICTAQLFHIHLEAPWLAGPTAVAGSIILMLTTRLVHPPAGGTALIAALGSKELQDMGFSFLIPTSIGASILVVVGVLFNNLFKGRSYPKYWL